MKGIERFVGTNKLLTFPSCSLLLWKVDLLAVIGKTSEISITVWHLGISRPCPIGPWCNYTPVVQHASWAPPARRVAALGAWAACFQSDGMISVSIRDEQEYGDDALLPTLFQLMSGIIMWRGIKSFFNSIWCSLWKWTQHWWYPQRAALLK